MAEIPAEALNHRINAVAETAEGQAEIARFFGELAEPTRVSASEGGRLRKQIEVSDYLMRFCNLVLKEDTSADGAALSIRQIMLLSRALPKDDNAFKAAAAEILTRVYEQKPTLIKSLDAKATPVAIVDARPQQYPTASTADLPDCLISLEARRDRTKRSVVISTNAPYSLTRQ